ncbi:transcription termination factor Rho [Nocardioides sp. GCM10027113]|uniref:transcription termination factor Rho n=1 Tax=unclassified Nocardioides TaxID=2615069 RepID=UPI00360DF53A
MTETIEPAAEGAKAAPKKRGGLNGMLLADLKAMAGSMGIAGAGSMKKAQLIEAIKGAQSGGQSSGGQSSGGQSSGGQSSGGQSSGGQTAGKQDPGKQDSDDRGREQQRDQRRDEQKDGRKDEQRDRSDQQAGKQADRRARTEQRQQQSEKQQADKQQADKQQADKQQGDRRDRGDQRGQRDQQRDTQRDKGDRGDQRQQRDQQQADKRDRSDQSDQGDQSGRDDEGRSRNRRRRGRDRDRSRGGQRNEPDTTILEDDVLVPAAGILDVLDNYAFVRTSGYLPGPDDVYLSLTMVKKYGLRRGDAVVGQVRQPREGERKEKFNPMVRLDSVNGADPEAARSRVEFSKLTPLYPSERLRLETEPGNLIGRVIDIAAPIGKGQRGLIVSPAKAGKTMIMQSIANSITTNNPECHLMVVLVDERPEEVTDFERSVKGEVISSTFDRPAADHTMVAELAIERAKRLVELGHDVVVLLDGITRLGRAYNLAAPASGRILSGGVDSAALYPPKRFFGAARNIENGGSLTILATALIESGSKMDEVIFEEFKGTGNMEIRLRRDFADKRLFPAIDAVQSGTRREELLMSKEELAIVWKLRRVLSGLDGQQALELLLERLRKSQTNIEFLMQVQKSTPTPGSDD